MHMRTKKWAKPELAECPFFLETPDKMRGQWQKAFRKQQPLHLELGCGKGVSTALMTADQPEFNFVAIDISSNVLGDARRNIIRAYDGRPVENILLSKGDICMIDRFFAPEDRVERIYIHFCNPWAEKVRHEKRRLTHPRQLMQYRDFLTENGEIWFKTDDDSLFHDSLAYFRICGFSERFLTYDLHASGFSPNYESEHEIKFSSQGVPIKFGIFVKQAGDYAKDYTRWHLKSVGFGHETNTED